MKIAKDIKPFKEPIYVTRPLLPSLKDVYKKIDEIWNSKWITNFGEQHRSLKLELRKYLKVKNLSLFCNGTLALQLAYQSLGLNGEVITTPFTFPATVNSLVQGKITPIFCDINLDDFNINSELIEELITGDTTAIIPVHIFGNPCNIEKIEKIARNYNLKVIYDSAHCFGVEYKGKSIGNYGDISMFSFHATKIFHTVEGGALTYNDKKLDEVFRLLKNFGIRRKKEVILPGINAKMNEIQAGIGLLNLQLVDDEIKKRNILSNIYKENLKDIDGIRFLEEKNYVKYNYQYFPISINEDQFGISRDQVYEKMRRYNILTRKYFHLLSVDYKYYNKEVNLPSARKTVKEVLCLPLYGELTEDCIIKICNILLNLKK